MSNSNKKHIIITAVITFFVTAAIILLAVGGGALMILGRFSGDGTQKLKRMEALIDNYYIHEYDKNELMDSALSAYAYALDDPYTEYLDKDGLADMMTSVQGDYVGIGIEVFIDTDNLITVIAPFDDSPAAEAGIMSGDKIVKVDGTEVSLENYNDAINMIKGEATSVSGKKVHLTIKRGEENFELEVAREEIVTETVKERMLANNIGYIRISNFGDHTAEEFKAALDSIGSQGAKGFIIDLRNNPGGTLDSVVKVADYLLPESNIITIRDKQGKEQKYDSDKDCTDMPLCVLINGSSASASEALAGAVLDNGRGTLVGEKSFGKGVVQTLFEMGDGTALKLTTAKYYTPGGTCIDKIGITPQVQMSLDEDVANMAIANIPYAKDYQLQKAEEILNQN